MVMAVVTVNSSGDFDDNSNDCGNVDYDRNDNFLKTNVWSKMVQISYLSQSKNDDRSRTMHLCVHDGDELISWLACLRSGK